MRTTLPAILIVLVTLALIAGFIYLETLPEESPMAPEESDLEDISVLQTNEPDPTKTNPRVFILSLDGMADWILDDMLEEGHLPNLQRILSQGVRAEHAYTTIPAKTAVGHGSIWTGTTAAFNGIHSNSIIPAPYDEHTCLHTASGYISTGLQTEPVWVTAARQGKRAVVVQATQNSPFETFREGGRFPAPAENLVLMDGYDHELARAELFTEDRSQALPALGWKNLPGHEGTPLEFYENAEGLTLYYLIYDDPDVSTRGYDTVAVARQRDGETIEAKLQPRTADASDLSAWSEAVAVTIDGAEGYAYFRLFELSALGSNFKLLRTPIYHFRSTSAEMDRLIGRHGGFLGNDVTRHYTSEGFGPTILSGGEGDAEQAFLETQALSIRQFKRNLFAALETHEWDLMISYLPFPDSTNHTWLGMVSSSLGSTDFNEDSWAWEYFLRSYRMIDEYVGQVYEKLPEGTTFVLVSDHGFTSVDTYFKPNVVLKQAGLLALDEEGEIDLSRTKAVYYPGSGDFVWINSADRFEGGIVAPEEVNQVRKEVEEALLAARDSDGREIVEGIIPREEKALHLDGPYAGDLYFQVGPGYYNSTRYQGDEITEKMAYPQGQHFGDPRNRPMNSICAFVKKGSRLESQLGVVPSIDISPIVCAVLGITPPANALGSAPESIVAEIISE